ncbi:DUF6114 domain-containing protein [Micromonospora sp. NPDC007271]|uniref:DUF6114 domain-containing protein n=1 Tax=Micromonospora sp. NPDC007271 TaxID=3154587 RepID=UPI0033D51922
MTTAETQHARPGRFGLAWRRFRQWRRTRPFWGGLFTALAGLEIFGSTQMSLNGLTFKMGPTGFLTWLIPAILVTCGMLLWFTPQQRIFYSVVAAVTAVYSLIGVNLGGFFIGLLLGMVGSALGFAWVPVRRPTAKPVAGDRPAPDEGATGDEAELALIDELLPGQREEEVTGVLTDTLPEPRNPLREVAPAQPPAGAADSTRSRPAADPDPPQHGHRDPRLYAILLVLASVSMAGLLALRGAEVALAAPARCPAPSSAAPSPSTSASAPSSASASPSPALAEKSSDGSVLSDLIDGITGLLTGGHSGDADTEASTAPAAPAVAAEPTATETGTTPGASTAPTRVTPVPSGSSTKPAVPGQPDADPCASPAPTRPKPAEAGKPLPRLAADPDQPRVAAQPAKLTGSELTMTGLRFDGIVDLPTGDGSLKVLKFSMDRAVTADFVLRADGPAGKTLRYRSDQLTVQGDVAFYTTRFVGWLLGVKITLTPDLPFPDGIPIPSPVPVTFTDPEIDLAFVDSNTLTAKPALKVDLA